MLKKYIKTTINPSMRIVRDYRRMRRSYLKGNKVATKYLWNKIIYRYSCYIPPTAIIGEDVEFPHPTGIVIGEGVEIGDRSVIFQNVTLGRANREIAGYPVIGSDCIVYSGATIVGPISITDGTIVAAGAVVTKSATRKQDVLVGSPAKSKYSRE